MSDRAQEVVSEELGISPSLLDDRAGLTVRRMLTDDRPRVLRHLISNLRSAEEAREVWQCFAVRALSRSGDLRDALALRGWMAKVLASTLADYRREFSRRRMREVPLETISVDDELLAIRPAAAFTESDCECVLEHLPSLRAEYADIVRRADILSQPREEIAASLDITVENVAVRLHRGRQALRRSLETACREDVAWTHSGCGCPGLKQEARCGKRVPSDVAGLSRGRVGAPRRDAPVQTNQRSHAGPKLF